jgi:hypothetical protein
MSAANTAAIELLEQIPEKQIVEELGLALGRTRIWYRAHGRPATAKAITKFLKEFKDSLYVGCVADDDPKAKPN